MDAMDLRVFVLATALVCALPAGAQPLPDSCRLPGEGVDPLSDRAGLLAAYERLPTPCLHAIFRACSGASNRHLLDFGSAAVCSFGYEALLSQGFGGNFRALMAWWDTERRQALQ